MYCFLQVYYTGLITCIMIAGIGTAAVIIHYGRIREGLYGYIHTWFMVQDIG